MNRDTNKLFSDSVEDYENKRGTFNHRHIESTNKPYKTHHVFTVTVGAGWSAYDNAHEREAEYHVIADSIQDVVSLVDTIGLKGRIISIERLCWNAIDGVSTPKAQER